MSLLLAQITDLHARRNIPGDSRSQKVRSREVLDLLPEALALCKERGVQFIAITGDLVDVPFCYLQPSEAPIDTGGEWVTSALADYKLIRDALDDCGIPYTVLPGNHDHYGLVFESFEVQPAAIDIPEGYRIIRFCDREGHDHIPRRIGMERNRWKRLIADENSLPQIHLQHFVLTPDLNEIYPHTYKDGADLAEETGESGRVVLALSGHYHFGTQTTKVGPTFFSNARAFSEAPHPVHFYKIENFEVEYEEVKLR